MTEILETIAVPVPHSEDNAECPFCPEEPNEPTYTTYPGESNNSSTLANNMNDPNGFGSSREAGARPKLDKKDQQSPPSDDGLLKLRKPEPIGTNPDNNIGAYSCEPHHLISGKQALAKNGEHHFEQWIKASHETIESDTGYSVNNHDNGLWTPSVPENTKGKSGAWGKLDRQAVANWIMNETKLQFHKGGHSIPEKKLVNGKLVKVPDDERLHMKYDQFLIKKLKIMNGRMGGWAWECPLCKTSDGKQKEKYRPSVRVNVALDRLSKIAGGKISGSRESWTLFISTLAWLYHDEVCTHTPEELETEYL